MKTPIVSEPKILKPNFHYHLVLHEPLIPPNTGNAGRLAVATDCSLHLIKPLGFSIDDKEVRRAGLDYWKHVKLHVHENFEDWLKWFAENEPGVPFYFLENNYAHSMYDVKIPARAALIFGKETSGIPKEYLDRYPDQVIGFPMFSDKIRSLNLANTIGIALYEAIRQQLK